MGMSVRRLFDLFPDDHYVFAVSQLGTTKVAPDYEDDSAPFAGILELGINP